MEESTQYPDLQTDAPTPEPEVDRLRMISKLLLMYVTPVIVIVGTAGNALGFAVFVRKRMRTKSVYFYLLLLACADTIILFTNAFKAWFSITFGWQLYTYSSDAACKIYNFVQAVTLHMSAWLIVLMTVDRFVAVVFPLKAASICTSRRAAIFSSICLGICCVYKSHLFWTYHLREFENGKMYCGNHDNDIFMKNYYPYLNLATYCLIPFFIVLTLNIMIVVQLRKRTLPGDTSTRQGNGTNNRLLSESSRRAAKERDKEVSKLTTILFLVSFSWLVLSLPFSVISLVPFQSSGLYMLLRTLSFILFWMNNAINFFLYCLSGQKIRRMIAEQLCGKCMKRRNSRANTLSTSNKTEMSTCL